MHRTSVCDIRKTKDKIRILDCKGPVVSSPEEMGNHRIGVSFRINHNVSYAPYHTLLAIRHFLIPYGK